MRLNVPLRGGEIELICRALRCYAWQEQQAVQRALLEARAKNAKPGSKQMLHYEDVKRQVDARMIAIDALLQRLLKDPELKTPKGELK